MGEVGVTGAQGAGAGVTEEDKGRGRAWGSLRTTQYYPSGVAPDVPSKVSLQ